ncbi:hypothetical protein F4819DRAFT_122054 [Hypoxylon fuscum]|nr:hypothetical protein F4819DRAFT_122054 [Hypoxylon fuscum]
MYPQSHTLKRILFACIAILPIVSGLSFSKPDVLATPTVPVAARKIVSVTITGTSTTLVVSAPNGTTGASQHPVEVKVTTTIIASLAFALTAGTYAFLVKQSAPLSNQAFIPTNMLEDNISHILEIAWPSDTRDDAESKFRPLALVFEGAQSRLYASRDIPNTEDWKDTGISGWSTLSDLTRQIMGYLQFESIGSPIEREHSEPYSIPAASPVIKHIVQVLIWEWVGVWLALAMIINTLLFNGFITNDKSADSILRLVLVIIYVVAILLHARYVYSKLYEVLSCLVFQATWLLLMEYFAFGEGFYYYTWRHRNHSKQMTFNTFEGVFLGDIKLKRMVEHIFSMDDNRTIKAIDHVTLARVQKANSKDLLEAEIVGSVDQLRKIFFKEVEDVNDGFLKQIKPFLDSEIKLFEKTAESSLERTLANNAIILGICMSTGLASLTSIQSRDATSTQLGSYALLLSVSTGVLALVSSTGHASMLASSAKTLLKLQEHVLEASRQTHSEGDPSWSQHDKTWFGLYGNCYHHLRGYVVTMKRLWIAMNTRQRLLSVFLGFVLCFLPMKYSRPMDIPGLLISVSGNTFELGTRNIHCVGEIGKSPPPSRHEPDVRIERSSDLDPMPRRSPGQSRLSVTTTMDRRSHNIPRDSATYELMPLGTINER